MIIEYIVYIIKHLKMFRHLILIFCVVSLRESASAADVSTPGINTTPIRDLFLTPSQNLQEVKVEPEGKVRVIVTNITSDMEFGVVQVHTYFHNVTISYNVTLSSSFYTKGSNVGLVVLFEDKTETTEFPVYVTNDDHSTSTQVLLILQTYDSNAPIPGGCNLEERVQTAPYLPTRYTEDILTVDYPLGSWPLNVRPPTCDRSPLQYDIYQYYLPEKDFTRTSMFQHILMMSNVKSIESNGRKVEYSGTPASRIKFANYAGTGRIVVVIVRGLTSSAAYVPTVSFGCNPNAINGENNSCDILGSTGAKLLSASLIFVGLFMTFCGHRFYKSQLFLLGLCITSFVSHIVLLTLVEMDSTGTTMLSIAIGTVGGAILLIIWARWGSPLLPVLLGCLLLGTLFSSTITYTPLADFTIMKDNTTFCLAFLSLVLVIPPFLLSFTRMASIVCTTVIGSFLFVIPLDSYFGSNLKYIILNVIRRATVSGFEVAIVDPTFQTTDLILSVVWTVLAIIGTAFQLWREKGRAPFPPSPIWPSRRPQTTTPPPDNQVDETSPLLSS